jgi:hypothetical protein
MQPNNFITRITQMYVTGCFHFNTILLPIYPIDKVKKETKLKENTVFVFVDNIR